MLQPRVSAESVIDARDRVLEATRFWRVLSPQIPFRIYHHEMQKRHASSSFSPQKAKRVRVSPEEYFEDQSKEVSWLDIEKVVSSSSGSGSDADRGWIRGKVVIVYYQKKNAKILRKN